MIRAPTFAEREGVKALPRQLELREVSQEIRARVWTIIHESIEANTKYDSLESVTRVYVWETILKSAWIKVDHKFADEFSAKPRDIAQYAKSKMLVPYAEFLEFLEFIAQHRSCPRSLVGHLNAQFESCGFAYRIVDGIVVPIANEQMAEAFLTAVGKLSAGYSGSAQHLKAAASALTAGKYADSVRESIHAVESVARQICPTGGTLGPALNEFENKYKLHPALKQGFKNLYGYTNDEEGIRHALIDEDDARVGEDEALYMLGACASFAAFLSSHLRRAEISMGSSEASILNSPHKHLPA